MAALEGVDDVELSYCPRGKLVKVAVEHGDAAAVPEAVRALALEKFEGGTIVEFESEWTARHGRIFEVEVQVAEDRTCEVAAKPDGTFLYTECPVTVEEIPQAVRSAIHAAIAADASGPGTVPGGEVDDIEKKEFRNRVMYAVEVEQGGREHKLRFNAEGQLRVHTVSVPAEIQVPLVWRGRPVGTGRPVPSAE